jgi:hypothetical protein
VVTEATSGHAALASRGNFVDNRVVVHGRPAAWEVAGMSRISRTLLALTAIGLLAAAPAWVAAQGKSKPKGKPTVPPPKWTEKQGVVDSFFADARKELQGQRPDFGAAPGSSGGPSSGGTSGGGATGGGATGGDGFAWSKLISTDTLEGEIKSSTTALSSLVKTPGKFKASEYKPARKHYSVMAVLFGVIARYDGDVRWKDTAPAMRDAIAKAGVNCKVGTDQSFNEAKSRYEDLAQLMSGGKLDLPEPEDEPAWVAVSDRPPLMQRMEVAGHDRLRPWLATKSEFTAKKDQVLREAQILAVLAHVIQDPSFDYADDGGYQEYAQALEKGCTDIIEACQTDNFEKAAEGAAIVTRACTDCHSGFR